MNLLNYKLHIIVEDDGLKYYLDETLALSLLPIEDVNVVAGGGWTQLFTRYKKLVDAGVPPERIIPILDGDTVNDKNPRDDNQVLENPNLKRIFKDLEYNYDNWMIAETLVELDPILFEGDKSPQSILTSLGLIASARKSSVQEQIQFHKALEEICKDYFEKTGGERSAFIFPSKMELAKKIAEITIRNYVFPETIDKIIQHIEHVASELGIESFPFEKSARFTVSELAKREPGLKGKVLVSSGNFLWTLDLNIHRFYRVQSEDKYGILKACWSPSGEDIACDAWVSKEKGGILVISENGQEIRFLSRNVIGGSESDPCWFKDGKAILIKTELGLCKKSLDSVNWQLVLPTETGATVDQRVSPFGRIAINIYDRNSGNYFLHVGARDANKPYEKVPNIIDTRAGVSWSSDGKKVAFVNHIDSERGAVCIFDYERKTTTYISSHDGFPRFVCFSPDDKFIIYTWRHSKRNYRELRSIEVSTRRIVCIMQDVSEMIIGCHAWKF